MTNINTLNFTPLFAELGYVLIPDCSPLVATLPMGVEGQTNHGLKTVVIGETYHKLAILVHELVHCLQRQRNLVWFCRQEDDGYYGTSIRGGNCDSFNEWQAHSVENFIKELFQLNRVKRELSNSPAWYHDSRLDNLSFNLITPEEWALTFIDKAFHASGEELVEWLAQYGFITTREVQ